MSSIPENLLSEDGLAIWKYVHVLITTRSLVGAGPMFRMANTAWLMPGSIMKSDQWSNSTCTSGPLAASTAGADCTNGMAAMAATARAAVAMRGAIFIVGSSPLGDPSEAALHLC